MADKKMVKAFLDDIEAARQSGRAVAPPSRLQRGNLLGAKTAAFKEAVQQDTDKANASQQKGYTQSGELFDMASKAKKLRSK